MRAGKPQTVYLSNRVMNEIDRRRGIASRSTVINGILTDALDLKGIGDPVDE